MPDEPVESVRDVIEDTPAAAATMKARAGLMIAIQAEVERWPGGAAPRPRSST